MSSFRLEDVDERLGEIITDLYKQVRNPITSGVDANDIYKCEQYRKAIGRVLVSDPNICFTTQTNCINKIKSKMRTVYSQKYVKMAINYVIFNNRNYHRNTYNHHINNNNNNNNHNNNHPTINNNNNSVMVPITIRNVYQTAEINMKLFIMILCLIHKHSIIKNNMFKFTKIFNIMALSHQKNVDSKIKTNIKKILIRINAIGDAGGGTFIIYDHFIDILNSISIDISDSNKIETVLNAHFKPKPDENNKSEYEQKESSVSVEILDLSLNNPSIIVPLYFTNKEWKKLFTENFALFQQRKEIYKDFQEFFFAEKYRANVVFYDEDGNCMTNIILNHQHDGNELFMTAEYELILRNNLCDCIEENRNEYEITDSELEEHRTTGVLLDERHWKAFHKMDKVNIVIHEIEEQHGNNSQKIFYDNNYQQCLHCVYYEINGTGHYNGLEMNIENYSFPMDQMNISQLISFIQPEISNSQLTNELNMLQIFDKEHKIENILVNHNEEVINIYGKKLYGKIAFLGDSALLKCATEQQWTKKTFLNQNINTSVHTILDIIVM